MGSPPFNDLTPAESERLTLLAEECAEVIQAVCKIQRHGYDSRHPDGGPDNRGTLEREIGDVLAALKLMTACDDVCDIRIDGWKAEKLNRVFDYMHHNGEHISPPEDS